MDFRIDFYFYEEYHCGIDGDCIGSVDLSGNITTYKILILPIQVHESISNIQCCVKFLYSVAYSLHCGGRSSLWLGLSIGVSY